MSDLQKLKQERGYLWEALEFIGDNSGICPIEEVKKLKKENKDHKEQLEIAFEMSDMKEAGDKMRKKLREANDKLREALSDQQEQLNLENDKLREEIKKHVFYSLQLEAKLKQWRLDS
tara:strand:+ start:62 stop:415 length:354 start_codon:yes stop_codon:yes gene_type:complete